MGSNSKVAFITGATSGIGWSTACELARAGFRIVACGRREDRLMELSAEIRRISAEPTRTLVLDVRDRSAIAGAIASLSPEFQEIDVLVNNAGLAAGLSTFQEGETDDWERMIDTNLKGVLYLTKAIVPGMIKRGRGDVVMIGSIAGHEVYQKGNVYCATKHAVVAFAKGLKMDLHGTGVRVTCIDPGMVETEFSVVRFHGDSARADSVYAGMTPLVPADIADAIRYAVTRPPHVNISDIIMLATDQSSATMVNRRTPASPLGGCPTQK